MYEVFQQLFPLGFAMVWLGGTIALTLPVVRKHGAYLRRFRPADQFKAMWQRQDDPALERLRLAVWRWYGFALLWELGVPLVAFGMAKLLL